MTHWVVSCDGDDDNNNNSLVRVKHKIQVMHFSQLLCSASIKTDRYIFNKTK